MKKFLLFLGVLFSVLMYSAYANNMDDAKNLIIHTQTQFFSDIHNKKIPLKQRVDKAINLIRNNLNLSLIGRVSLGVNWRRMNDTQRKEFNTYFGQWAPATISTRISTLGNTRIVIGNAEKKGKDFYIHSSATSPDTGNPIELVWRIRYNTQQKLQIIDLTVANVSLVATQRSEFNDYIKSNSIKKFLSMLKEQGQKQTQFFFDNVRKISK